MVNYNPVPNGSVNRKRITKSKIKQALSDNHGNVAASARALGCTRVTIYRALRKYPDVREARETGKKTFVDLAHDQLKRQITEANGGLGDVRATTFALETWGKEDGWAKRTELEMQGKVVLDLPKEIEEWAQKLGKSPKVLLDEAIASTVQMMKVSANDDADDESDDSA